MTAGLVRSLGVELLAAAVFLVPGFLLFGRLLFSAHRRIPAYLIFCLYLSAVSILTGLPTITYIRFEPHIQWIPFREMAADARNEVQNLLLFVPLGLFLPLLWQRFRRLRRTAAFGCGMSAAIEGLQLFSGRATDINDVIMNTLGTVIGWLLAALLIRFMGLGPGRTRTEEIPRLFLITFGVLFFLQPFLSRLFWGLLL